MRVATVLCGLGVDMRPPHLDVARDRGHRHVRAMALSMAGSRAYPEVPPRGYPRQPRCLPSRRSPAATEKSHEPKDHRRAAVGRCRRDRPRDGARRLRAGAGARRQPRVSRPRSARREYMVCYPNVALRDAFYRAAPRIKLVQLLSAGYDDVDLEAARRAKRAGLQQRRRQRHLGRRARADADARRCRARWSGSTATCRPGAGAATARRRACTSCTARRSASSASAPSARRWRAWRRPSACACSTTTSRA